MSEVKTSRDILVQANAHMRQAVEALSRELASLRAGRATPALVEHLRVDYYGVPTPLNQIATITAPEARLLLIQPWERSALGNVEKAILKSDLSLTPTNDGTTIRLVIPPLTQERRQELVKLVKKRVEEARVELRNRRRDALGELRQMERTKSLSADERQRSSEQLQKLTDSFIVESERAGQQKEKELLES